jgi:ferrous iron transport protein B
MHDHGSTKIALKTEGRVILVGNPNVGKSVIFGKLTGRYVTVSNYPGTTVEVSRGVLSYDQLQLEVIDTPGINSLFPHSEDERVTRDIILEEKPRAIVQVADTKNLLRTLLIAFQLAELDVPLVLNLNMADEALSWGIEIDGKKLSQLLGCEAVETVAVEGRGIAALRQQIPKAQRPHYAVQYSPVIEEALSRMEPYFAACGLPARGCGLMLLSGDEEILSFLERRCGSHSREKVTEIIEELQSQFTSPLSQVIALARDKRAREIWEQVLKASPSKERAWRERLGRWTRQPLTGIPILIVVLWLIYEFVGRFGAKFLVDFIENTIFGEYINPGAVKAINFLIPLNFLKDMLVGPYGLITMGLTYSIAIVLPVVGTFFLAFGFLEDSGYLPRLSILSDKIFRRMGLNGKAALPMVLGLGCDTMATLTTRILETPKERLITTLLLALGVPCSAQLGVVMGMLAGISYKAALIVFGVVLMQVLIVGYLSSKILPGQPSDFIFELPPIRWPKLTNLLVKTAYRVKWFLKEAVPLFLMGTLVLFLMDKIGLLGLVQRAAEPLIVGFLDLPTKATEAFVMGFLRRDYGAAGLFAMTKEGLLTPLQIVVSLIVITLFVPCVANFLVMIKEQGIKKALWIVAFIVPFAFLVGGGVNWVLRWLGVGL